MRTVRTVRTLLTRPDDLELVGDHFDHEFTISRGGRVVATATRTLISIRDTGTVDVAPGQRDLLILATVLAADLAEQREHADGPRPSDCFAHRAFVTP